MIDTIYVGMTGMTSFAKGLKVIGNNVTNLNTPGFKGSSLQFADMYASQSGLNSGNAGLQQGQIGQGVDAYATTVNYGQGTLNQTGNDLDVAVDGQGLFVFHTADGTTYFSRAGQFGFNADGVLVNQTDQSKVMGADASGAIGEISLANLKINPAKETTAIRFSGNLSSTDTEHTISGVKFIDRLGGEHQVTVTFVNINSTTAGAWTVTVTEGASTLATGQIVFTDGRPNAGSASITFDYTPVGQTAIPIKLDFTTDTTAFAAGADSTLTVSGQDGYASGSLTKATFDTAGYLVLTYSNGQTVKDKRLALARFDTPDAVASASGNKFVSTNDLAWHIGLASIGGFGQIRAGQVEMSNVDLTQEFSDLIVMQRGYQASSQVISTANDMIQELFDMKGRR